MTRHRKLPPSDAAVTRGNRSNGFAPGHDALAGLIGAYADQELPPGTALEVERHVARCPACQRTLRLHQSVRDRLGREAAPEVPTALRDRILGALGPVPGAAELPQSRTPRRRVRVWWIPVFGLAAGMAALLLTSPWDHAGPTAAVAPPGTSDSLAILGLVQAHAAAWNRRDAKAAAAVMTPDAVWVTSGGLELRGRRQIERAHAQWLAQDSAAGGTIHVHPPESIAIRFLRADVAVLDLTGQFVAPTDGDVREEARIFAVATKDRGVWHIAQLRNLRREVHGPASPR